MSAPPIAASGWAEGDTYETRPITQDEAKPSSSVEHAHDKEGACGRSTNRDTTKHTATERFRTHAILGGGTGGSRSIDTIKSGIAREYS